MTSITMVNVEIEGEVAYVMIQPLKAWHDLTNMDLLFNNIPISLLSIFKIGNILDSILY